MGFVIFSWCLYGECPSWV